MKQELNSDAEDYKEKEKLRKAIKKEKKDKDGEKKSIKKEVTEKRKLSIVFKEVVKPSTSKASSSKDRDRERGREDKRRKSKEREKHQKSRDKKTSGNVSDVSLSDEETYRKMLEYHTSSQWNRESRDEGYRGGHVREWDRDKYRRGRSRDDDRQ